MHHTRSIRLRLQLWQGCILLAAVGGLATFTYLQQRERRFAEIDAELCAAGDVLGNTLRGVAWQLVEPTGGRPSPPTDRGGSDSRRGRGPPPGFGPGPRPPSLAERLSRDLRIPTNLASRFAGDAAPYLALWRASGELLHASTGSETLAYPGATIATVVTPGNPSYRLRDGRREVLLAAPAGSLLLVGRSVERELADLDRLAWLLLGAGTGLVVLGLLGGGFLAGRALRPIQAMAATAAEISATSLSRRIDATGAASELAGLAGTLNDAFARLEASFAAQARFTADASHELRTPVAVILAQTELALAGARSDQEYREALAACQRAAQRLRALVDSMLRLSRLDTAPAALDLQPIDLAHVAGESVELLRPLAEQRRLRLTVSLPPCTVSADAELVGQALTNLVANAILYNREGGRVEVSLARNGEHAILTVADTGLGIPEADLPHVFERFYRVDKARSRAKGGSGLGLAIVRSIVEAHRGRIAVESQMGTGTTFRIELPLDGAAERGAAAPGSTGSTGSAAPPCAPPGS